MALEIAITIDKAKMVRIERALAQTPRALPRIMVRALKRSAKGGRTEIDRQVREKLAVKKKAVMKRIVDEVKPSHTNWLARLGISSSRLALSSFSYRWSKRKGLSYTISKGLTKRIPSGFVRSMPRTAGGSYKALFRRAGDEGQQVPRYPLVFLRGPSIGRAVADAPEILARVESTGSVRLEKEVHSQINLLLAKRWPK